MDDLVGARKSGESIGRHDLAGRRLHRVGIGQRHGDGAARECMRRCRNAEYRALDHAGHATATTAIGYFALLRRHVVSDVHELRAQTGMLLESRRRLRLLETGACYSPDILQQISKAVGADMYYVINAAGQTEGPHPADWVRANASAATLVSHDQRWVRFDSHPDFRAADCPGCEIARQNALSFCTTCGRKVEFPGGRAVSSPSPNLALLNILVPGIAQMAFGQVAKGIVILVSCLVTSWTVAIPIVVMIVSVIDGFKVGQKLRRTGVVAPWEFFPS